MPATVMDVDLFGNLLPDDADLWLTSVSWGEQSIAVDVEIVCPTATCPQGGEESSRIDSRYERCLQDVPCCGMGLELKISARKFICNNSDCKQSIFCERLPELAGTYARTTNFLTQSHESIGFALGGEAGARLAAKLDMPTSADTLLRRVKAAADEPAPPPRYVGVDDWAYRAKLRHHPDRSGTSMCD